jgi:hypothetical protein
MQEIFKKSSERHDQKIPILRKKKIFWEKKKKLKVFEPQSNFITKPRTSLFSSEFNK